MQDSSEGRIPNTNTIPRKEETEKQGPKATIVPVSPTDNAAPDITSTTEFNVQVHRLRDLEYIPQPICAMAAWTMTSTMTTTTNNNNTTTDNDKGKNTSSFLAISRQDGSLELKTTYQHFWTIARISGRTTDHPTKIIKCLQWIPCPSNTSNPRPIPTLIGASASGHLSIIDWSTSQLLGQTESGGGGIFALSQLLPTDSSSPSLPLIAAACQDGSVRIYQVRRYVIELLATFPSAGAAVLSLTWRVVSTTTTTTTTTTTSASSASKVTKWNTVLFCGIADGTIRRYDCILATTTTDPDLITVDKISTVLRMTVETKGRRISTKVWCLHLLLKDAFTLVAGTSLGKIQFWNGHTGTLIQSIQHNELSADVLQLVTTPDEHKIFCSGVDPRVVCIERSKATTNVDDATTTIPPSSTWFLTHAQRPHTHDVLAMAMIGDSTLATGGIDTKLVTYSVRDFSKQRPSVWYPWPSFSPIEVAAEARILLVQRNCQVDLYRLQRLDKERMLSASSSSSSPSSHPRRPSESHRLGTVKLVDCTTNLVSSAISPDGSYLAICNASSFFVFQLNCVSSAATEQIDSVNPQKIDLPEDWEASSSSMITLRFASSASQHLLFAADSHGKIHIMNLDSMERTIVTFPTNTETTTTTTKATISPTLEEWPQLPIRSITASPSGSFVATLSHSYNNAIHIFTNSQGDGDEYSYYWTLPNLSSRPSAIRFLQDNNQLAVATSESTFYIFDLQSRSLSSWSEKQRFPMSTLPAELKHRKEYPIRLCVNPSDPTKLIMVRMTTPSSLFTFACCFVPMVTVHWL